jgi:hypothetical protein
MGCFEHSGVGEEMTDERLKELTHFYETAVADEPYGVPNGIDLATHAALAELLRAREAMREIRKLRESVADNSLATGYLMAIDDVLVILDKAEVGE